MDDIGSDVNTIYGVSQGAYGHVKWLSPKDVVESAMLNQQNAQLSRMYIQHSAATSQDVRKTEATLKPLVDKSTGQTVGGSGRLFRVSEKASTRRRSKWS